MTGAPASIGERAVMEYCSVPLSRLRCPERQVEREEAKHAARIDTLVAEHVAAKDAEIKRLRAMVDEFQTWALSMCKAECGPYRKIGRHGPNCPCADLGIESNT